MQQLSYFRLISLVGCVYKIVSKIFSVKLKKVFNKVIDARQSTFLEGRGAYEWCFSGQWSLRWDKEEEKSYVFFKVDFRKAYDSVRWDFIYYMLDRLGFCEKWISYIKACLESTLMSVLVNGSPTKEFILIKGLRQGDPLAPFLFLIAAESLVVMFRTAIEKLLMESLEIGKRMIKGNMLQYLDDTLFFDKASIKSMYHIQVILNYFDLASDLKVNFLKSRKAG